MSKLLSSFLVFSFALQSPAFPQYKRGNKVIKITHSERKKAYTPEEELASFSLPEGFIIELVASEKNGIINPIDLTFDDAGRLWTQTAEMYPLDPFGNTANRHIRDKLRNPKSDIHKNPELIRLRELYQLKQRGTDRILVIDNPTKAVTGQVPVVAKGLTMPQSILPYKNGVYVAHGSEMLYLEDADQDGTFELPHTILTGFSFIDSHTMSHTLVRGPGNWIHFSHGAMNLGTVKAPASGVEVDIDYSKIARFSLDGKKLELVSSGLNNIWGFQLRADGQWYGSEANDLGMSVVPMESGTGFLGIGNDQLRDYQPVMPGVHDFRVGGTGISGLAFSDDDSNTFPEEWRNLAFLANPITNTINTVRVDRDAEGNITGTLLDDLLKSEDDWFRPVNIEFGPDGCLYIADWYNKIVSHNELPRTDPSRDKTHGRIWRIRHKSQKIPDIPNLFATADDLLPEHLKGPSRWEQRAAWHQIADRQAKSTLPALKEIVLDTTNTTSTRIHTLWAFESLTEFDESVLSTLIEDKNHNIRREAIRSLASFNLPTSQIVSLLKNKLDDPHCIVRSQVIRTLGEIQTEDLEIIKLLISACKTAPSSNELGGSYEVHFERYLARKALETYPTTLREFLDSSEATQFPIGNLLWASQALGKEAIAEVFPRLWKLRGTQALEAETFVSLSHILDANIVRESTAADFNNAKQFENLLKIASENEDRIHRPNLREVLSPALKQVMNSQEAKDQQLAMTVAALLKSPVLTSQTHELLSNQPSASNLKAGLPLLLQKPKDHLTLLKSFATNNEIAFGTRLKIIHALVKTSPKIGNELVDRLLENASNSQRQGIVNILSQSKPGAKRLLQLLEKEKVSQDDFSLAVARQLISRQKKNPQAQRLVKNLKKIEQEEKAGLDAKVEHLLKACETLTGNPQAGQGLFHSCLTCHALGKEGNDIAPALDGSANRELHALITAIVNPDAAVEGGYNLHRVVKKDGDILEGYLYKSGPLGLTIATAGNIKTFVAKDDIASEGSVPGKSFMPMTFGNLPEQTIVDLVAYIQTLK